MTAALTIERLRIHVYGAVQGVGFRPFVYRLASSMGLAGTVLNSAAGVFIEIEGGTEACREFLTCLHAERPAASWIAGAEISRLAPAGYPDFRILESSHNAAPTAAILPDLATCPECLAEVFDPANRRSGYAFTNCTHCGPRYTIVTALPYDRPNTTMRGFTMCSRCEAEYRSSADRRFHAQPNACPECGPKIEISPIGAQEISPRRKPWDADKSEKSPVGAEGPPSLPPLRGFSTELEPTHGSRHGLTSFAPTGLLDAGSILALKGIGGFQLLCDATNSDAVRLLRARKHREQKPFAVLFPDLAGVHAAAHCSPEEAALLTSPAAPIVLLRRRDSSPLAPEVCMSSPYVGAMLPCSPLHHLLAREFGGPLVCTSGNLSDEPITTDNADAATRLAAIADAFLTHDRPIARPADDSVVRLSRGRELVLRRARGYAPLPVLVLRSLPRVLALGGHLKSSFAIALGRQVVVSQHIGDLDTLEARAAFERAIDDLMALYEFRPDLVACDLHPDYYSTEFAATLPWPVVRIQHHQAHVAACAAENDIEGDYLGVSWDGTGYGIDGTVWGGEFFVVSNGRFDRIAHLRPFRLFGGDAAARDCRRPAFALLRDTFGDHLPIEVGFTGHSLVNAPLTTSAGRLFDAVAAITGCALANAYEGQAGMSLEAAAVAVSEAPNYQLPFENGQLDWRPLIADITADLGTRSRSEIARGFHAALADAIAAVARTVPGLPVVLSGGVFQNACLVDEVAARIPVFTHQRIPPNDGGIALGQAMLAPIRVNPCPSVANKGVSPCA
jgi:hydrogenase maturation protein HypF